MRRPIQLKESDFKKTEAVNVVEFANERLKVRISQQAHGFAPYIYINDNLVWSLFDISQQSIEDAIENINLVLVSFYTNLTKEPDPCEYCNPYNPKNLYISEHTEPRVFYDVCGRAIRFFDEEYPGTIDSFKIAHCPNCGRKL